jgi:hypothetical protein
MKTARGDRQAGLSRPAADIPQGRCSFSPLNAATEPIEATRRLGELPNQLAAADCDRTCLLCKEESQHVLHIVRISTKKITPERMIIMHKYCVKDARQNCYSRAAACVCNDCGQRPCRRRVPGRIATGGPDNSPIIRGHTRALLRRAPAGKR